MTARIAGYVSRKDWGALPPKATTPLNGRRMEGIAVHHGGAGGYADHAKCASQVRAYQRMHLAGDRGPQNDIAYNMLVCRHGYVYEGRTFALQGGANGTSTANRTYFSVCVLGDGDVAFSPTVTDALEWVIHQARTKHNAGMRVRRHRDFFATGCPGTKLAAWTPTVDNRPIQTLSGTGPLRKGDRGEHVATVQKLLIARGYDVGPDGADGSFGAFTDTAVRLFQSDNGLMVDGVVGPQTLAALSAPAKPTAPPPPKEDFMPAISPQDWRKMTTGAEYAAYKNVLADDPETAPRIPLGQAAENAATEAKAAREEVAALRSELASVKEDLAKILGYVSGV